MIWNKKLKGGEVIQYTLSQWWTRLTEAFSPSRSLSQPQWKTSYHLQQNCCSEDKTRQSAKEDPKWPNQWWLQSSQHRHTLSGINLDRLGIIEIPKWKKKMFGWHNSSASSNWCKWYQINDDFSRVLLTRLKREYEMEYWDLLFRLKRKSYDKHDFFK